MKVCLAPTEGIKILNELYEVQAFVISSGAIGQHLVPEIHDIQRLSSILFLLWKQD